jgi:predicted FMN-binding regulatory protein PaiB
MPAHYPQYESTDIETAIWFAERYPHGIITVNGDRRPTMADAPLLIQKEQGTFFLAWHLMRSNPVFDRLGAGECVVRVMGPSAHTSPTWYHEKFPPQDGRPIMAPTWDYVMAEFFGTPERLPENKLRDHLSAMVGKMESTVPNGLKFAELPPDYVDRLLPFIGAFRMAATDFTCRIKLNQDLGPGDWQGIIEGLEVRGRPNDLAIVDLMRKLVM